ncbi:MAG: hypothetical protein ACOC1E_01945 [Marinilabiliaceae bacterium]
MMEIRVDTYSSKSFRIRNRKETINGREMEVATDGRSENHWCGHPGWREPRIEVHRNTSRMKKKLRYIE